MAAHGMFLAMILKNAQRLDATSVILAVDDATPRIEILLPNGSSHPITTPPAGDLLKIIELLEKGQRDFFSSVFAVTIESVKVQRGATSVQAKILTWSIGHNDQDA